MEGLTLRNTSLKNLKFEARRLASDALSLTNLFSEEASRLKRWDEASRLRALYFSIRRQLDWLRRDEDVVSYGYSQANLVASLGGLAVGGLIKIVSTSKQLSAFADYLLKGPASKERPFGMVLVCIGSKGLPDDAEVVSISRLARESDREESEVVSILQEHGYLLLSEKAFSLLIDRLTEDVQEGRLRLPVSRKKLSEITASGGLKPDTKNQE